MTMQATEATETDSLETLSGVMVAGIRTKCRILDTGDRRFALIGPGVESLRRGDRVRVVGHARDGVTTPCGVPFAVVDLLVA